MDNVAYHYMIVQILIPIICFTTYPLIRKITEYMYKNPDMIVPFIVGMIVCLSGFCAIAI